LVQAPAITEAEVDRDRIAVAEQLRKLGLIIVGEHSDRVDVMAERLGLPFGSVEVTQGDAGVASYLLHGGNFSNVRSFLLDHSASILQDVKITFSAGDGPEKTLYYFSTNLTNDGVKKSGFLAFCSKFGVADAFVKSALR
jgi:hypothetical protein